MGEGGTIPVARSCQVHEFFHQQSILRDQGRLAGRTALLPGDHPLGHRGEAPEGQKEAQAERVRPQLGGLTDRPPGGGKAQ